MSKQTRPDPEWDRPSHVEIRQAITLLGDDGHEEIRQALHSGFEPFEKQMWRRMKTRLPEKRPAYKALKDAGEQKVRQHLAASDMEGLKPPRRPRKNRPRVDRNRLIRSRTQESATNKETSIH